MNVTRTQVLAIAAAAANSANPENGTPPRRVFFETMAGEASDAIDATLLGQFLAADRVLDPQVLHTWSRQQGLHKLPAFAALERNEQLAFSVFARTFLALLPMVEETERAAAEQAAAPSTPRFQFKRTRWRARLAKAAKKGKAK